MHIRSSLCRQSSQPPSRAHVNKSSLVCGRNDDLRICGDGGPGEYIEQGVRRARVFTRRPPPIAAQEIPFTRRFALEKAVVWISDQNEVRAEVFNVETLPVCPWEDEIFHLVEQISAYIHDVPRRLGLFAVLSRMGLGDKGWALMNRHGCPSCFDTVSACRRSAAIGTPGGFRHVFYSPA